MIQDKTIKVAKEIDDVMELVEQLIVTIRTKGNYTELIDELINAINGADEIDDEVEADLAVAINTIGARAGSIALSFKKAEPVATEVAEETVA